VSIEVEDIEFEFSSRNTCSFGDIIFVCELSLMLFELFLGYENVGRNLLLKEEVARILKVLKK
jgi:hypothetical protein